MILEFFVPEPEPEPEPELGYLELNLENSDGRVDLRKRAGRVGMQETMMPMVISMSLRWG